MRTLTPGDLLAALNASIDQGGLLLDEKQLSSDFFDLRTGFAGEVLQKFTNYRARLAIVVADPSNPWSDAEPLLTRHFRSL